MLLTLPEIFAAFKSAAFEAGIRSKIFSAAASCKVITYYVISYTDVLLTILSSKRYLLNTAKISTAK